MAVITEARQVEQAVTVYQCDWCAPGSCDSTQDPNAAGWTTLSIHVSGFDDLKKYACPECAPKASAAFSYVSP